MKVPRSVAEILSQHTTLTLECIDRLYLNVYVPVLQRAAGAAYFFRKLRGCSVPSSALMGPMTRRFVEAVKCFAEHNGIDIVTFRRGERKDERTQEYLRRWSGNEGVLYIGKAQEKARVLRTEQRHDPTTGATYPWLYSTTAMVNHFYFYAVDDDFGPFFLKFCSYFPYNAKLCLNGHEYLKRQLTKQGIGFEALDNGILRCADPEAMQRLADGLTAEKIDALLRKWLARLPHPFSANDREQGIRYDISMLQAEFARTEVFYRPVAGRVFFEEVMRENLDMGRPDHVQLIFNRRVNRRTPTRYRTRVITDGVIPSLHVDYKHSRIKAVPQGGARVAHRDGHQRHVRLRCRPPAEEPRCSETDRLCCQPTPARRPDPQPRLHHRNRSVRRPPPSGAHRRSTRLGIALSATRGCRHCLPRCCASTCCQRASATASSARRWRRCAGSRSTTTTPDR